MASNNKSSKKLDDLSEIELFHTLVKYLYEYKKNDPTNESTLFGIPKHNIINLCVITPAMYTHNRDYMIKNKTLPWSWDYLSRIINLDFDFVVETQDRPWIWILLSHRHDLTKDLLIKTRTRPWNYGTTFITNILLTLDESEIMNFLEYEVDWSILSREYNFTLDIVKQYHHKIQFQELSDNKYIKVEIIKEFPNKDWDWLMLSFNEIIFNEKLLPLMKGKNISLNHVPDDSCFIAKMIDYGINIEISTGLVSPEVVRLSNKEDWDYTKLTTHEFFKKKGGKEFLFSNPDKPWNFNYLSSYCMSGLMGFVLKSLHQPWNWDKLSKNPKITPNNVRQNKELPWVWNGFNHNNSINQKFIEEFCDKGNGGVEWVNWDILSFNTNLRLGFIDRNNEKPWDWSRISSNKHLTVKFIKKYIDKPWNWRFMSDNNYINEDIVSSFIDKEWCWYILSTNKNISSDFILRFPDKPWSMYGVSENPNLTESYIMSNIDILNIKNLSKNKALTLNVVHKNIDYEWVWRDVAVNKGLPKELLYACKNKINVQSKIECYLGIIENDLKINSDILIKVLEFV